MTAQQRSDQQRSDRRVAEQAPTYAAESREADGRERAAARWRRGLPLSDAIELSLRVRRGALEELARR